jgi:hypothetical protein
MFYEFFAYIENTWIGRMIGNRQRARLYPIEMWNSHQLTADLLPRTGNNYEAWHRCFQVIKKHIVDDVDIIDYIDVSIEFDRHDASTAVKIDQHVDYGTGWYRRQTESP